MKCVYSSIDKVNVQIAKSILDSEGIESFIPNDNMTTILGYASIAFGAIELMVNESEYDDAEKALAEFKMNDKENNPLILNDENSDMETYDEKGGVEIILCPKCRGDKITKKIESSNIFIIIIFVLFGIPLSAKKLLYVCRDCDHVWKK